MEILFENLIKILDKEIELYNEMKNLYAEKKEILIKNNIDELSVIDNKIMENNETIKHINSKRLELMGEENKSMTELIKIAEEKHPEFVLKLKEQQAKLLNISSEISVLNMTNIKLIEHGLILADKKLNIIIDACAPKGTSYSESGKEGVQDMSMSTIVREA